MKSFPSQFPLISVVTLHVAWCQWGAALFQNPSSSAENPFAGCRWRWNTEYLFYSRKQFGQDGLVFHPKLCNVCHSQLIRTAQIDLWPEWEFSSWAKSGISVPVIAFLFLFPFPPETYQPFPFPWEFSFLGTPTCTTQRYFKSLCLEAFNPFQFMRSWLFVYLWNTGVQCQSGTCHSGLRKVLQEHLHGTEGRIQESTFDQHQW